MIDFRKAPLLVRCSAATALLSVGISALASAPKVVVSFKGAPLKYSGSIHPFLSQRTVMVPFRATSTLVGAKIVRNPDGKHVTLTFGRDTIYYEPGHHGYKLNGHRVNMRAMSESKNGHLYVPIRLFNDVTAGRVHAEIL